MPERQRTLLNTLDWSFSLLSPGEQALFACLGVFAGTFGPGPERYRLHLHRRRRPGPGTIGLRAEPAAGPRGGGSAGRSPGRRPRAHAGLATRLRTSRRRAGTGHEPAPGAGTGERTEQERVQYLLVLALVHNFLGQIQLSNADYDRAAQLFTAGLDAARSSPDRFTILISLYDLALSSQARGDLDGVAGLLRQGLSLAAEAGDEPAAAYYLEALAAVALQQDDPPRAARLLAAAGAQLQASGSGWLHAYVPRAPNDHSIEAELRSRMGDAAYEQAAAHGRSLTGTRAIRDGLEDEPQDPQRQESPG